MQCSQLQVPSKCSQVQSSAKWSAAKCKCSAAKCKWECSHGQVKWNQALFYSNTDLILPSLDSPTALPNDIVTFFNDKVTLPALTLIINLSLQSNIFPTKLKHAQFFPILKKFNNDPDTLNNYHPIPNHLYISKLVERTVAEQSISYIATNDLFEPLQLAYCANHSTETAVLYVLNDLLVALDSHSQVLVSLFDCSVASDLVDHSIETLKQFLQRNYISEAINKHHLDSSKLWKRLKEFGLTRVRRPPYKV